MDVLKGPGRQRSVEKSKMAAVAYRKPMMFSKDLNA